MLEILPVSFEKYLSMKGENLTWEQAVDWLRSQPEMQQLVKDCYFDLPTIDAARRFSESDEWISVKALLSSHLPGKVLDIGAGAGISSYSFAKEGCEVIAIEPDPSTTVGLQSIINLSQACNLNIHAQQACGEALPYTDNLFDIVYGRQVLHHARDLEKLCTEAKRVLKPGGLFIATREHVISHSEDLETFLQSHPLHALYSGENAYLLKEYTQAIQKSGLKIKSILGPFDSIINYSPVTATQNREMSKALLKRLFGETLASFLSRSTIIYNAINHYRSWRCATPGRLYSFLATKPHLS